MSDYIPCKATIYSKTHRSGNTNWKVKIGKLKKNLRSYKTIPADSKEDAIAKKNEWNNKRASGDTVALRDVGDIERHEILAAHEKLAVCGVTIKEAADFYLKFGLLSKAPIKTGDALTLFLKAKAELTPEYLSNYEKTFLKPFVKKFPKHFLNSISPAEAENYIVKHKNWSPKTHNSHLNYLTTFFNYFIKKGYVKLNPFKNLDRRKETKKTPKVLSVKNTKSLLQYVLDHGYKKECTCMVLVFFCGARVKECSRLTWEVAFKIPGEVALKSEDAKEGKRRINEIPVNAKLWLEECKGRGSIAPQNYLKRMQKLRKKWGGECPQNSMRHSFTAYHIAKHKDSALTAFYLGHPNPALMYKNYLSVVSPQEADEYWDIIPDSVLRKRAEEKKKAFDESRVEAELMSNIGKAVLDESGVWHPVMDENIGDPDY